MAKKALIFFFVFSLLLAQAGYPRPDSDIPRPVIKAVNENEYFQILCSKITVTYIPSSNNSLAYCYDESGARVFYAYLTFMGVYSEA